MARSIGEVKGYIGADNTAFLKALAQSEKEARSFAAKTERYFDSIGKSMTKMGQTATIGVTVPVVAAGTAMAMAAIDAEETRSKFAVVFSDIQAEANAMAETLRDAYGLGRVESQQLLSDTGDLLSGFDFTQEAALDMSAAVNKLAVDLTSFSNFKGGAAEASRILTKMLLGEAEAAKSLSIAINQDTDEYKAIFAQMSKVEGVSKLQAKAMTILEIATKQSKNAIGDYARTADSTSNLLRLLWTRTKDLGTEIGVKLVPYVRRFVLMGLETIKVLERMSPETLNMVIQVAALAAAMGPALLVTGKLASSISSIIHVGRLFLPVIMGVTSTVIGAVAPILALVAGATLLWAAFGDLVPVSKIVGTANEWMQKAFKSTATFFDEFKLWWGDSNADISESTRTAIDFISKAWLSLRFAWNAVQVGLQSTVQTIIGGLDGLLSGFAAVAEFAGLDGLADGARKASSVLRDFVVDIEDVKSANLATMKKIQDSWSNAPEQLKKDVTKFTKTVQELGTQAFELLESSAPEAVESVKKLIAQINEIVAAGNAGTIKLPTTADGVGPKTEKAPLPMVMGAGETSGLAFLRQLEDEQQAHDDLMLQKQWEFSANWAEQENARMEASKSSWDTWVEHTRLSLDNIKDQAAEFGTSIVKSFASNMAAVAMGTRKWSAVMTSMFQSMGQRLLEIAIEDTIATIAWAYAAAIGKAAGSAPTPWLIPVYVAAAIGFFSAAMSGTVAGGASGGSGGGGAAAEPAVEVATASRYETNSPTINSVTDTTTGMSGPDQGDGTVKLVVIESEFEDQLMSFGVKATKNGAGDGSDRFLTTQDLKG